MTSNSYNNSVSKLVILSANVNGFGNNEKRREFFLHIEKVNPDIICLSDTRFSTNIHDVIKNETNNYCFFNSLRSNARGVAILIKKTCPIIVNSNTHDDSGNLLWLHCTFEGNRILIGVIYGPNEDCPEFFDNIFNYIEHSNITDCIITGDFNVTLTHELDNYNYAQPRNIRARNCLNQHIESNGFIDAYRHLNNNSRMFTWKKNGGSQRSRLDMFLTSSSLGPYITNFEKYPSFRSDHNPIILTIDYSKFKRGKGFWKHNAMLLKDTEYISRINSSIKVTCAKYLKHANYRNFYQDSTENEINEFLSLDINAIQELEFTINPHLLLEMLLMDIRNETISYSTAKYRRENEHEKQLFNNYTRLQNIAAQPNPPLNIDVELQYAETIYNEFIENRAIKINYRNKVTDKIDGEKPSKYFCSLEKNFNAQKYISKLKVQNEGLEVEITDQDDIQDEIRKYYADLYDNHDSLLTDSITDFLDVNTESPKLTDEQSLELEKEISLEELSIVLKNTKNSSSPGYSGFTYEFYKFFWRQLGSFIHKATVYSFEINKLPNSQTIGIISLIPKGEKPKEFLDSWRPITLQNSIYKIISGVLAKRLNGVLPHLIHLDQCGFVPGRYIGDCIRTTYDVIEYAKRNNRSGLLLLIDFRKAFDSISFKFIEGSLIHFGFKENFIKWIKILLNNFKASINHAGNISTPFQVLRGCRQGDPIASALFVLCIEILCLKLRNSENVKGFKIGNLELLLSLYADDCSIFLEYESQNLRNAIQVLNSFHRISGLEIQIKKTQCTVFGKVPENYILCHDLGLKWDQQFKLLGVTLDGTLSNMDINYDLKLLEIRNTIMNWQYRFLTPLGRACVAKTLLLSKLSHLAFVIPSVNKHKLKLIENEIYQFIWKGADKVARTAAKQSESRGGLNFPDIVSSWKAFKFSWFRRLRNNDSSWKHIFAYNLLNNFNLDLDTFQNKLGTLEYDRISKSFPNTFWVQCLHLIKPFLLEHLKMHPDNILTYPIWGSSVFMRNTLECKRAQFGSIGDNITYPLEITKFNNNEIQFLTSEEYQGKFGENPDPVCYTSLKQVIRMSIQKLGLRLESIQSLLPFQPPLVRLINYSVKGCNRWVKLEKRLNFCNKNLISRERKWEAELGAMQGISFWERCYQLTKTIFFDNKIKWFHYQVVRGTLKTNCIIAHFVQNITPDCTFCNSFPENVSHLLYECNITSDFLNNVYGFFITKWEEILVTPSKKEFIFGSSSKDMWSPVNLFSLYVKYYIWIARCRKFIPVLNTFLPWFKNELKINQLAYSHNPKLSYLDNNNFRMEEILTL